MKKISCIMANYNTDALILKQSIDSIINQNFNDFELIIVDDCSTDEESKQMLLNYKNNKLVKIISNQKNIGLAASLNKAIELCDGEYIARMDTDDIAHLNRFKVQYEHMKKYNTDISGSFARIFGDKNGLSLTPFYKTKYCMSQIFFSCCLLHPTVMIKKKFLYDNKLRYNESFSCSQDFELWSRCITIGKIDTINQILLDYRIHNKQISVQKKTIQKDLALNICSRQLNELIGKYNEADFEIHKILCGKCKFYRSDLKKLIKWIKFLITKNKKSKLYDNRAFSLILKNRLFNIVLKSNYSYIDKLIILCLHPIFWKPYNIYSILYRLFFQVKSIRGCK